MSAAIARATVKRTPARSAPDGQTASSQDRGGWQSTFNAIIQFRCDDGRWVPEQLVRSGAQLCPIVGGGLIFGPYDLDGVDYTTAIVTGGLALGVPFSLSSGMRLVPNVAVRYEYDSQKQLPVGGGESLRANQSFGVVDVGFAWVLRDAFSIQPTYQKPFGLDQEVEGTLASS